jgi:glucose-6-phosphate 1-dehydrogenase
MVDLISLQEKRCLLPHDMKIIGFAPDEMSHDEFIKIIRTPIKLESPRYAVQLDQFCERCSYVSGHEGGDESFRALQKRLEEIGLHKKEQNRLFYFSLPPKIFVPMSEGLKKFCYSKRGISRIIVSFLVILLSLQGLFC